MHFISDSKKKKATIVKSSHHKQADEQKEHTTNSKYMIKSVKLELITFMSKLFDHAEKKVLKLSNICHTSSHDCLKVTQLTSKDSRLVDKNRL